MILAFNFKHAIHEANWQARETGRRQVIRKRRIVNKTWWTVQETDLPRREPPCAAGDFLRRKLRQVWRDRPTGSTSRQEVAR